MLPVAIIIGGDKRLMGLLMAEHVGVVVFVVDDGGASSSLLLLLSISDDVDLPCPLSNSSCGSFHPSPVSPHFPMFPPSLAGSFCSSPLILGMCPCTILFAGLVGLNSKRLSVPFNLVVAFFFFKFLFEPPVPLEVSQGCRSQYPVRPPFPVKLVLP